MSRKLEVSPALVAAAALVILGVLIAVWAGSHGEPPGRAPAGGGSPEQTVARPPTAAVAAGEERRQELVAEAPLAAPDNCSLRVLVERSIDGSKARNVAVVVRDRAGECQSQRSDDAGAAMFSWPRGSIVQALVGRGSSPPILLTEDTVWTASIAASETVVVRVIDGDGMPLTGATVTEVLPDEGSSYSVVAVHQVDHEARCVLTDCTEGTFLKGSADGVDSGVVPALAAQVVGGVRSIDIVVARSPATLSGEVRLGDVAVVAAYVELLDLGPSERMGNILIRRDAMSRTRTDGSGLFAFDDLRGGRYLLTVKAPGGVDQQQLQVAAGTHVSCRLQPRSSIAGRVLDSPSNRPVAGAEVRWIGAGELGQAVSDEQGAFLVYGGQQPGAASADTRLLARHPGFGKAEVHVDWDVVRDAHPVNLVLRQQSRLRITIKDGGGAESIYPIVKAQSERYMGMKPTVLPCRSVDRFEFEALCYQGEKVAVQLASPSGLRSMTPTEFDVPNKDTCSLDITAARGGASVAGQLLEPNGGLCTYGWVRLLDGRGEVVCRTFVQSADGRFLLRNVMAGTYRLAVTNRAGPLLGSNRSFVVQPGEYVDLGVVGMEGGARIVGELRTHGDPLPDRLLLELVGASNAWRLTAVGGRFVSPVLAHGDYACNLLDPGWRLVGDAAITLRGDDPVSALLTVEPAR
jgi:hypothetical protein